MAAILLFAIFSQAVSVEQRGSASIAGIVVKAGTDEPISGAVVELSRVPSPPTGPGAPRSAPDAVSVTTSVDGTFNFSNLAAGEFRLVATRPGGMYTAAEYGKRGPNGRGVTISLAAEQSLTNARLEMAATGTISGRVYDRNGDPIAHALVMAMQPLYREGQRRMGFVQAVQTNDRGEYRLFWLPPGRYYIGARPEDLQESGAVAFVNPPDRVGLYTGLRSYSAPSVKERKLENGEVVKETYLVTYFGGETDPSRAQPIDLQSGANISAIDIPMANGTVRARSIRGAVINSLTGQRIPGATITLTPRTANPLLNTINEKADQSGIFTVSGLAPGTYHALSIWNTNPGTLSGFAMITIEEKDVENIEIIVRPQTPLKGRIAIEGVAPLTGAALRDDLKRRYETILQQRPPGAGGLPSFEEFAKAFEGSAFHPLLLGVRVGIRNDDVLTVNLGAPAGLSLFAIANSVRSPNAGLVVGPLPAGGYVKSMRMGALDLLNADLPVDREQSAEIEIVIAMDAGAVQGRVLDEKDETASSVTVVLVPDAPFRRRFDLYKTVTSDSMGRFTFKDVAPGGYKILAWNDVPKDAWTDPEYIRPHEARGQAVHVGSAAENVEVRVIR